MDSQKSRINLADAIANLRSILARALAGGDDPSKAPELETNLVVLENDYSGPAAERLTAFAGAVRNPGSIPGVSRAVVIARGQRFLLSLAVEIEDAKAEKPAKKASKKARRDTESLPGTPYDPELTSLKGVGPKTAARLASRGVASPRDILFLLPRRYEDRRTVTPIAELTPGYRVVTAGTVSRVRLYGRPWKRIMELELVDGDHKVLGMWFSNRRPRQGSFVKGARICLAGLVSNYKGRLQIAHPVVVGEGDDSDLMDRVVPVYPEVPGVPGRTVEKAVRSAATRAEDFVNDPLSPALIRRRCLMRLTEALRLVHIPPDDIPSEELDAWVEGSSPAHKRLAYDEFYFIQLALALRRRRHGSGAAPPVDASTHLSYEIGNLLDLTPTAAQARVISEIAVDLKKHHPMQRLLQGDVGSGKTLVALCAIVAAVRSDLQAALMAPTEILAEQHMRTLYPVLERLGIRAALHIGQARSSTRKKNLASFERGTVQVAIGTHALIQESVRFHRLGLAIVDEQHRFGVSQRLGLVGKGPDNTSPHLLVMTATPIPRTLALTVHGDLDVSVIDELPPGRRKITTHLWSRDDRNSALAFAEQAFDRKEQVYVVCPTIEDSQVLDVRSAEDVFEDLSKRFGEDRTGLLHGRLSPEEKEAVMTAFVSGRIQVLVTTTVIEVGVDVPNATVMIIESAERFGLAQLHQLRGRVGRSHLESSCHLISDPKNADAAARLDVLAATNDGFEIAEADLHIRGPGELYGRRQAGLPGFRFGHLIRDADLLQAARDDVADLVKHDPSLTSPDALKLREELAARLMAGDGPVGEEAG
ncbi:MAG: ATP-dependent DNA helicase RecG [Deltaproteobacteria bacterium]|nr:ATP-dependent DNA helicase RecG [Deltaproteobacteria bacterium]